MVIWLASGKSLLDFINPVWRFLWPMMLIVAVLSTVVGPWARQQIINFEDEIQNRGDVQRVSPGQFRESFSGQRVFFLENPDNENGRIGTVFIRSMESTGRRVLLVSSTGRFETDVDGQQWVVLERGYRTDMIPGQLESRTTSFDAYRIRMDQSTPGVKPQENTRAMPTLDLMKKTEPGAKGEIALRIGLPLLTLALGILAIPLAVSNARSGRAVNLILALLIYLIASNLFSAVKAAVGQGKLSFAMAWWPLPLGLLLLAAIMFWWRMTQKPGPIEWLWSLAQRAGLTRSKSAIAS
jgi:lipopolysaccharide export system permease protein